MTSSSSAEYQIIPGLPVNIDINAYSGDTWNQKFRLKQGNPPIPIDLTPYTIKCQIRNKSNAEVFDLQTSKLDQTNPDTQGIFILSIPSNLDPYPPPANYAYDVQLTDATGTPAIVTTWIAGRFFLEQDVTRP
jgi:hypothetical protein